MYFWFIACPIKKLEIMFITCNNIFLSAKQIINKSFFCECNFICFATGIFN